MTAMKERFYLVYQPIVFVSEDLSHQTQEYEVLLRSKATDRFPFLEFQELVQSGEAYDDFMHWYTDTLAEKLVECPTVHFSVNMQLDQFVYEGTSYFLTTLAPFASRIIIELTEHEPEKLAQENIAKCICQIRQAGFLIALDDVNTGANDIHFLAEHAKEIYRLKFSLIHFKELSDITIASLLEGWRHVAKTYKKEFVVEGIESKEVSKYLSEQGVCLQQGYLFGKGSTLTCTR